MATDMEYEPDTICDICGVTHVHTIYSDGTAGIEALTRTARSLGLDFVVITDHMTPRGRQDGWQGIHDGVHVVVGYEHEDHQGRHHYLVMGVDSVVGEQGSPQVYVDEVRRRGGIGFIAHPFERRSSFKSLPPYPWVDWSVEGYDGIEIWNQMSEWVEGLRTWLSVVRLMYPRRFLAGPPGELLAKWDELNRRRFVAGIGGVDAHTRALRWGPFRYTLFPLKVELKGIRTHLHVPHGFRSLPSGDAERCMLQALRDGRGFVSNCRRGDARGARFRFTDAAGRTAWPGRREEPVSLPGVLSADMPLRGEVRLICDGAECMRRIGRHVEFPVDSPGVYRIEAHRQGHAWIYTNPFPMRGGART